MTDALLSRLQRAEVPVSGARLAATLGVTRAAIHKRIKKLRTVGHRIAGTTRVGYRWAGPAVAPSFGDLTRGIVSQVIHVPAVGSTQEEAKGRAARGAPEGTLVVADRQTAGRGRLGRSWDSPFGGLWYSLILRPTFRPDRVPALTLVAALEWVNVLRARGVPAGVKWPNDVWVDGKKVAGILTEMSAEMDRVHWVVLGVGVNVNNRPPAVAGGAAGAVSEWTGPLSLAGVLGDWVDRFSGSLDRFRRTGFASFRRTYDRRAVLAGARVSFEGPDGRNVGRARGVDGRGRLRVSTRRGDRWCEGGEVSLVRPRPSVSTARTQR